MGRLGRQETMQPSGWQAGAKAVRANGAAEESGRVNGRSNTFDEMRAAPLAGVPDIETCRRELTRHPLSADWHARLGLALLQSVERVAGLASLRRAAALEPAGTHYLGNLGAAYVLTGAPEVARDLLLRTLACDPDNADALSNLALIPAARGETANLSLLRQTLARRPGDARALYQIASASRTEAEFDTLVFAGRALAVSPLFAEARLMLASSSRVWDRALSTREWQRAAALAPSLDEIHYGMGVAFDHHRDPDAARHCYRRAAALNPANVMARWNGALAALMAGDYAHGFRDYEWRWRLPNAPARLQAAAEWTGEPFPGGTLCMYAEQGLGDAVQFARFVPAASARSGAAVLAVPRTLVDLFKSIRFSGHVIPSSGELPPADRQVSLLSLPRLLGVSSPAEIGSEPYISADASRTDAWRRRLGSSGMLTIGLCWRGNPSYPEDARRSPGLAVLAPLLAMPGLRFVSLVMDPADDDLMASSILDVRDELAPMSATAALMSALDLVITSDTSAAHVAGALGCPAWVMLSPVADWRWGRERDRTSWYPSLRLFRQSADGDWASVVREMQTTLAGWTVKPKSGRPVPGALSA